MKTTAFTTTKSPRMGIYVLKGIAISGVILYHLFPKYCPGGFLGVPLFFILSGYLMFLSTCRNRREGTFQIGTYYKKRFQKIMIPLFVMVMTVCCFMTLTNSRYMIGIRSQLCSIFGGYNNWWQIHQNNSYFTDRSTASPFTHLWYLSVQMQFYVIWPFIFLAYRKVRKILGASKARLLFLVTALLSVLKMAHLYTPGGDPSRVYYGTDTMAFHLFLGMWLGAVKCSVPKHAQIPLDRTYRKIISLLQLAVIVILYVLVAGTDAFLYRGGMLLISLFFVYVIYFTERYAVFSYCNSNSEEGDISRDTTQRTFLKFSGICKRMIQIFAFLGKYSYELYLWHYPLIRLLLP